MTPCRFSVRLLSATEVDGTRHLGGSVVEVDAAAAYRLVRERKALLLDLADLSLVLAAAVGGSRWTTPRTR